LFRFILLVLHCQRLQFTRIRWQSRLYSLAKSLDPHLNWNRYCDYANCSQSFFSVIQFYCEFFFSFVWQNILRVRFFFISSFWSRLSQRGWSWTLRFVRMFWIHSRTVYVCCVCVSSENHVWWCCLSFWFSHVNTWTRQALSKTAANQQHYV
jgi:hypothetical protein